MKGGSGVKGKRTEPTAVVLGILIWLQARFGVEVPLEVTMAVAGLVLYFGGDRLRRILRAVENPPAGKASA